LTFLFDLGSNLDPNQTRKRSKTVPDQTFSETMLLEAISDTFRVPLHPQTPRQTALQPPSKQPSNPARRNARSDPPPPWGARRVESSKQKL